ncbi:MAG TPA: MBL fold metallo-hydrolase [Chitinophagales bacterium]|nr:MBL fold metallo-hydrolase [Chitinophagales bacterium]
MKITITHVSTACVIININGYRILTDPVLDHAGKLYHFGYGTLSRKTEEPALQAAELGKIDLVLLSHHQHQDNLDTTGKAFIKTVPLVLTTPPAAKHFTNAVGLANWQSYRPETSLVPGLIITATPAQHHPWWLPGFFAGKVIGFMIEWAGQQNGALYLTGDTVYFKGLEEVARRFTVNTIIVNLGSVQFRYLTGWGRYTFNAAEAIKTALLMKAKQVIPIHYRGWTHFKENEIQPAFNASPIATKTIWLQSGRETEIDC